MSMLPWLVGSLFALGLQDGKSETLAFTVKPRADGQQAAGPVTADLRVGQDLTAAQAEALGERPAAWLEAAGEPGRVAAAEWVAGEPRRLRVWWLPQAAAKGARLHLGAQGVERSLAGQPLAARLSDGQRDVVDADGHLLLRHLRGQDASRHADTCRPYWHVFAGRPEPLLLTKGLGGRYPHHRGLYAGWNKVERDGKSHDFWHCKAGETLRHVADLTEREVLAHDHARLATRTEWVKGEEGFVREETTLELWLPAASDGALAGIDKIVDVTLRLEAIGAAVRLSGDPHHAGLHFRAATAADDNRARTRFARSPSAADQGNDIWTGCDWVAYAFVLEGERQAEVILLDHPDNPRPSQLSTRDYGRVGFFRALKLEPGQPVVVRARLVVLAPRAATAGQPATPSAELAARLWQDYVAPPRVELERAH